jgi:hypothetical protein
MFLKVKHGALAAPIGEAGQIQSTSKEILQIFFSSLHCTLKQSKNSSANNISKV